MNNAIAMRRDQIESRRAENGQRHYPGRESDAEELLEIYMRENESLRKQLEKIREVLRKYERL